METATIPQKPEELTKLTQSHAMAALVPQIMNAIGGGDRRTQQALQQQAQRNSMMMENQKEQMFMRSIFSPTSGEITQDLLMQQAALYGINPQKAMQLFIKFDNHRKQKAAEKIAKNASKIGLDVIRNPEAAKDYLNRNVPGMSDEAILGGLGKANAYTSSLPKPEKGWVTSPDGTKAYSELIPGKTVSHLDPGTIKRNKLTDLQIKNANRQGNLLDQTEQKTEVAAATQKAINRVKAITRGRGGDPRAYIATLPENIQAGVYDWMNSQSIAREDRNSKREKGYINIQKDKSIIAKNNAEAYLKLHPTDKTFSKFKKSGDLYSKQAETIVKKYKTVNPMDGSELSGEMALQALVSEPNAPKSAIQDWSKYQKLMKSAEASYNKANGSIVGGSPGVSKGGVDLRSFDIGNNTPAKLPQASLTPVKPPITQLSKDEIKNIYRFSNLPGSDTPATTPLTIVQSLASKAQDPQYEKFGEGKIEKALRDTGIETNLQKQKAIAKTLKSRFPDATEAQIVLMIKQSAKAGL